jgi:uncharacterized BrkB/YihY/UPF0761 family membrane protein
VARAQSERERHGSVDAAFEIFDHDAEIGGGIMAGALAYRLFIWLLPLALVAVAGLGFAADAASKSPEDAAKTIGLAGLVSTSISGAAESTNRWYAILIGIPILLYTTRSLLRALIITHRLVWTDLRGSVPKPTPILTLKVLPLFVGLFVISSATHKVGDFSFVGGLVATALIAIPYASLWLCISILLPHHGTGWRALVPGAILFAFGVEVLQFVVVYVVAPQLSSKQGSYGALGVAAALLFALYLLSRLVIATAVVNATLAARRARSG